MQPRAAPNPPRVVQVQGILASSPFRRRASLDPLEVRPPDGCWTIAG